MHPADLGPSSLPLSLSLSSPLPSYPSLLSLLHHLHSSSFLLSSRAFNPPSSIIHDLSPLLPPPVAAVAVAVAAAAAAAAPASGTPATPLALVPPPPPFAALRPLCAFLFFGLFVVLHFFFFFFCFFRPLPLLFFFPSFLLVNLSCERIWQKPGECIQRYVPRARERLELLSKTGASSRIMGGCRCDRAENATSLRFSCLRSCGKNCAAGRRAVGSRANNRARASLS